MVFTTETIKLKSGVQRFCCLLLQCCLSYLTMIILTNPIPRPTHNVSITNGNYPYNQHISKSLIVFFPSSVQVMFDQTEQFYCHSTSGFTSPNYFFDLEYVYTSHGNVFFFKVLIFKTSCLWQSQLSKGNSCALKMQLDLNIITEISIVLFILCRFKYEN